MKSLQLNPGTALPGRSKELIGLAVAAQVPCRYCIVAHTEFARLNGASETEIGEAVAMAAVTRHWSTYLNGIQTDEAKFRAEIARIVSNVKQASASKAAPAKPIAVVDGQTALAEITQSLGYAPEFLKRFPDVARAGAWRQMRDVQLNPATASSGKTKELMGLAVASQIPCRFCVIAHTEFAKLNGASDAEFNEAIAMASLTRDLSTLLNGMQVDEPQFRKDVDRIVKGATAAQRRPPRKRPKPPAEPRRQGRRPRGWRSRGGSWPPRHFLRRPAARCSPRQPPVAAVAPTLHRPINAVRWTGLSMASSHQHLHAPVPGNVAARAVRRVFIVTLVLNLAVATAKAGLRVLVGFAGPGDGRHPCRPGRLVEHPGPVQPALVPGAGGRNATPTAGERWRSWRPWGSGC